MTCWWWKEWKETSAEHVLGHVQWGTAWQNKTLLSYWTNSAVTVPHCFTPFQNILSLLNMTQVPPNLPCSDPPVHGRSLLLHSSPVRHPLTCLHRPTKISSGKAALSGIFFARVLALWVTDRNWSGQPIINQSQSPPSQSTVISSAVRFCHLSLHESVCQVSFQHSYVTFWGQDDDNTVTKWQQGERVCGHVPMSTLAHYLEYLPNTTGGWWHLNWGGQARGNGWSRMSGMVSNTWFPWFPCVWCHSIGSIPDIIMNLPPISSLHCFILRSVLVCGYRDGDCLSALSWPLVW